jgi:hypothetical protein
MEYTKQDEVLDESLNDQEELEEDNSLNESEEEVESEQPEEETEELEVVEEPKTDEEAEKLKQIAENQKIRAEKAEKELKKLKGEKSVTKPDYTLADIRALSDVHDDEVERITEWAKFKGVSIAEAKKDTVMQAYIAEQKEKRRTANATNTESGARGSAKISDDRLYEDFKSGKLPKTDEDMTRLAEIRLAKKMG